MDGLIEHYFLLAALAWILLQAAALWMLRGAWRVFAWIPAAAMGLAFTVATLGVLAGSNIAPIWVVLALPPCLLWIVALWLARAIGWAFGR